MAVVAIASMTAAHGLRQPVTWLTLAAGVALLLLAGSFGLFTFYDADRYRLLASAGVAVHVIIGVFLAVTVSVRSIRDELTSHTAATLFAKPVSRTAFVVGKCLGGAVVPLTVGGLLILSHCILLAVVATYGFDVLAPPDQYQRLEAIATEDRVAMGSILANHGLAALHSITMTSVACALAIWLPPIPALLASFAVFVGGHLLTGINTAGAIAIPALPLLRADELLQDPTMRVDPAYFVLCACYTGLYVAGCLVIATSWFKRQDIA